MTACAVCARWRCRVFWPRGCLGGMVNHEVIVNMDKVESILILADAARSAWVLLMGLVSQHNAILRQRRDPDASGSADTRRG